MALDGIDAEVLFPGASARMWDNISDKSAIPAIVYGYNEFLAKQYCAVAPDRLIAMGVMPTTGLESAMAELEHCAKLGLKGIVLRSWPNGSNKIKPEDDRFWAAVTDMDMPVTMHGIPTVRGGEHLASRICIPFSSQAGVVASFLAVSGAFDRFPKLQVYFAESLICWVPAFLANMDVFFKKYRFQYEKVEGLKPLTRMPSEIIREHCLWGFMDDRFGLELLLRGDIRVENALWETDFPHKPTEWPHSMEQIERIFAGVPEDKKRQLTAGNVIRYFHLDAAQPTETKAEATAVPAATPG
jgi:predicted TIM-barrel fold metal-dependent hydrolase